MKNTLLFSLGFLLLGQYSQVLSLNVSQVMQDAQRSVSAGQADPHIGNEKVNFGNESLVNKMTGLAEKNFSFMLNKKSIDVDTFHKTLETMGEEYFKKFPTLKTDKEKKNEIYRIMGSILRVYTLDVKITMGAEDQFRYINAHMAALMYFIEKWHHESNESHKNALKDIIDVFAHQLYDSSGLQYATDIAVSKGSILKEWFNTLSDNHKEALIYYVAYGLHGLYDKNLEKTFNKEVGKTYEDLAHLDPDKKPASWRTKAVKTIQTAEKISGVDIGKVSDMGVDMKVNDAKKKVKNTVQDIKAKAAARLEEVKNNAVSHIKEEIAKKKDEITKQVKSKINEKIGKLDINSIKDKINNKINKIANIK